MNDALDTTEAELCVERIAAYQAEENLSDIQLVRKFPQLGSSRTWRTRLAIKNWTEAPIAAWLPKLQAVVARIEGTPGEAGPEAGTVPTAFVTRHLVEAQRCRTEHNLPLARSHCRAARQAIENFQRTLNS